MILVDTSAWIEFFNKGQNSLHGKVIEAWLHNEDDVCLTELIITEILQGYNFQ